ncbi:peptidoglycan-binding protein [Phenylobacterium sp.]|uniref:peptidoglycan-binding protein n=1 Tax=Phenylobacterium sp. TaxID=1871053 RepID=UPI003563F441
MTAAAPWSVKGIDPKAREVAKELARRSGMTLGEWLNRVILEDDVPEEVTSEAHFSSRPQRAVTETPKSFMPTSPSTSGPDDLGRIAFALDLLTDRIESSEMRTGLAISGVEHSVRHAMARLETAEREQLAVASRQDAAAEKLAAEQAAAAERLRRMEEEVSGPRSTEALRALENAISRVAGQVVDGEERRREGLATLEARLAAAEAGDDPKVLIEEVVTRLGQRMADAEARTGEALESLRDSLVQLDQRMHAADGSVRSDMDRRLEALADQLTQRVEEARAEIADRLASAGSEQMEVRLGQMADEVAAVEQRSARAIETMGREVLSMAETLNRRVQSAEQRSAEAIEQVGGEIARIAGAVEGRLGRTDQLHAEALERLGAEIGRITDRLTDRILQSERRAAQAIDDVGEQVAAVTERIEQRHERAASDLAERLRQSEERNARLLEAAQDRLRDEPIALPFREPVAEQQPEEPTPEPFSRAPTELAAEPRVEDAGEPEPAAAPVQAEAVASDALATPMVFGAELFSRAESVNQPALDPGNPAFDEEDFAAVDAFAPISEQEREEDPLDLEAPKFREDARSLSTREVIEQARATARAAAEARRDATVHAPEPSPRRARRGLFAALKPGRPTSTWQTALMVAGGAAFLSVGAAGVVLMEGPHAARLAPEARAIEGTARAALALSPGSDATAPPPAAIETPPAPVASAAATAGTDPVATDYVETVRAVEAKQPGALAHMKTLADDSWAPAQLYLARLYETGQAGVVQNLAEARRWTQRAAEAGDPPAMHNLALYYFRGEGGPQDAAAAAQWFKKAAQHGVVDSQYNLGLLYQSGSGVPRDLAQAYRWFSIAANAGDPEAKASATDLAGKLPATQLAAAESQAAAFEPALGVTATPASGLSVLAAQKVLGRLGYYKGRPDGAVSSQLKLAVTAYQRDQGLAATGSLDPATVSRLSVLTR